MQSQVKMNVWCPWNVIKISPSKVQSFIKQSLDTLRNPISTCTRSRMISSCALTIFLISYPLSKDLIYKVLSWLPVTRRLWWLEARTETAWECIGRLYNSCPLFKFQALQHPSQAPVTRISSDGWEIEQTILECPFKVPCLLLLKSYT